VFYNISLIQKTHITSVIEDFLSKLMLM